jgi:SNF2 family DNA or RNA helicase
MSDPGTGKTRAHLEAFANTRRNGGGPALVFAPKSILQPAWGDDIEKFTPHLRYSIATASNRQKAFSVDADIYITNHDAAKWLQDHPEHLKRFNLQNSTLIVDESTAFKHSTSQRSKALRFVAQHFIIRRLLTGTPNPNTVLDLWHQGMLLDDGYRLGNSFFKFRANVCAPVQIGPSVDMIRWEDKPGAELAVAQLLADITLRHKLEECTSIPPNHITYIQTNLSPAHRKAYDQLAKQAILAHADGDITSFNAGVLKMKLLQLCSGAIYDGEKTTHLLDTDRYNLVLDLVEARKHCLVAFNWRHQREQLVKLADNRGISFAVIDGSIPDKERIQTVAAFQAGELKVIFAHPASAAHGLTLTRGTTTIWASPVHDAEKFVQFNHRIYRTSQTEKTETILIAARDTLEPQVYADNLNPKLNKMTSLLDMLQTKTKVHIPTTLSIGIDRILAEEAAA